MRLSEVYSSKVDSCISAISHLGYDVLKIIESYKGQYFSDGPEKSTCFTQIINKDLNESVYNYLNEKCNLAHFRDARQPYEYGIDLVLGWLIEDAVLALLKEKGKKAILSGNDRYREFLSQQKISTQPDIKLRFNSGDRLLEIFSDWTSTWHNKNHADLRDNKYMKVKREEAVMLGIAPITSEGFLIDFSEDEEAFEQNYVAAYRKMGYTFKGIRNILRPLEEVIEDLLCL
jgi:hypothetical protein